MGSSWRSRSSTPSEPLTPTYIAPRSAPRPPPSSPRFLTVFRKNRTPSLLSATSSDSASTTVTHPYSAPMPPLPVVSSHGAIDDDDECPVCLEPLSFSFRLPGEKPHIVPECGHALHDACFTAVYGPSPHQARGVPRKTNLGVCGVCRRPMKVGDGDGGKSNKLAALTGMGDSRAAPLYPGRDTPTNARNRVPPKPYDPSADDPIDHASSLKSASLDHQQYIVTPSIQVRPEFSSLTRTADISQPLTCIVVVELPGKRPSSSVPGPVMHDLYGRSSSTGHRSEPASAAPSPGPDHVRHRRTFDDPPRSGRQMSLPASVSTDYNNDTDSVTYTNSAIILSEEDSPFSAITEDLRNRIIDWKGHPLSDLGPLQLYDLLSVRRDTAVREFYVYLFKEAIICVVEEKKRGLGRLLQTASESSAASISGSSKGVLRLKGRIYVRHIKNVTASSAAGEMSLTIDMEDEMASFILIFKERSNLEAWKNHVLALVQHFQQNHGISRPPPARVPDLEEFGGSQKAMRMLSGSTGTSSSTTDSILNGSGRSTLSSSTSHHSGMGVPSWQNAKLATLGEDDELNGYDSPFNLVTPHTSSGPSNSLTPLPHPPMDLILVVSLPPPTTLPSTAQLKIRVIKTSLDFLVASMGAKDRLSIVTFEVGVGGKVRKTPFLSVNRTASRERLEKFIQEIGMRIDETQDEFLVRGSKEEKTDVVTAVNHGLDVVLQRKARNPVSGMLLVSDASDSTRRAQMDLVLARAEAANIPIHSFGYGRSHDPASLWLMSNHTSGTYTFVKDWYDLRDCLAGCVGGMMSIGLINMKLHLKIVDSHRFRIRKVSGGPSSIVSTDGQNADIDLGELRYGEKKEMLIELELDNTDQRAQAARREHGRSLNATDQFVQAMGLDSLSIDDADLADGMMDRMIDEVPVIEVDGSFFDPLAGKHVSRLAHPVLLTVTLLPHSPNTPPTPRPTNQISDPVLIRRRMELLASDMITRALVLVSKRNYPQAQKIMGETKRILHTVLQNISRSIPQQSSNGNGMGGARNRKEMMALSAVRAMQSILQDLQILSEALDDNTDLFQHDQRNFGAQQAMILRDQKSWTGRSATERLFWTTDNSIELVSRSTDWIARE